MSTQSQDDNISAGAKKQEANRWNIPTRLYSRAQAACYCGLSKQAFSAWVKAGRLPAPLKGTARWDRKAIDTALDSFNTNTTNMELTALDQWRANRARHS
jgi:hypothetical protein